MKLRTLVVTILVLAILSAFVALMGRRSGPVSTDARVGKNLIDRGVVEKAGRLQVADQGKTVTLVRQKDGTWRVASYFDLPADFQKLSRFVDDLYEAKIQRLVTTNPERIARLEFKDTKIALLDRSDKELWAVTLGKAADSGGRFVRFDTEPKAYLANVNAWIDADPKNWADTQLLNLKADQIAKVELAVPATASPAAPAETLVISRSKKEDPWTSDQTPAHQQVNAGKVSSLLGSLGSLRFSDTTELGDPKVAAAKSHERRIKVTTFDGKSYTVTVAQVPEEKKLKPPTPAADGQSGPAALGKVADLKGAGNPSPATTAPAPKVLAPEFETIPAGPAFVSVTSSDPNAPVNGMMQKRAFQIADYTVNSLPKTTSEFFEPAPPPPAPAAPVPTSAKPATPPAPANPPATAAPGPKK